MFKGGFSVLKCASQTCALPWNVKFAFHGKNRHMCVYITTISCFLYGFVVFLS